MPVTRGAALPSASPSAWDQDDPLWSDSTYMRRGEAIAILAREDLLVRLVVVGEPEVGRVPAQFLPGEASGLDGEESRVGDAPANRQRRPQGFLGPKTIIRPILPMVARGDFRERLVGHHLALAEDGDLAIGLEQQRAFLADHHRVVGAHFRRRQAERSERWQQAAVV